MQTDSVCEKSAARIKVFIRGRLSMALLLSSSSSFLPATFLSSTSRSTGHVATGRNLRAMPSHTKNREKRQATKRAKSKRKPNCQQDIDDEFHCVGCEFRPRNSTKWENRMVSELESLLSIPSSHSLSLVQLMNQHLGLRKKLAGACPYCRGADYGVCRRFYEHVSKLH